MVASNDQTTEMPVSTADLAPAKSTRKVLFSAMKNEAPFLLEWIAYHKLIGFDEIVICSNPSNDGMEEILAALDKAGEIRHLQAIVPQGESPQIVASKLFTREIGYCDGDWYILLDADEFLNIHVGDHTVDALIEAVGQHHCALINWRVFGTSGQTRFPGRCISSDFVGAAQLDFSGHLEQKTFFRFSKAIRSFGLKGITRPLMAAPSGLGPENILVGTGATADPFSEKHRRWLSGIDARATPRVAPHEVGWALAQVNHYIIRTPEFFLLKKVRGRGYKPDAVGNRDTRHTDAFFAEYDRNEEQDRSILRWEAAVTAEMERLASLPGMGEALSASARLVEAAIASLDESHILRLIEAPPVVSKKEPDPFIVTLPADEAALLRKHYTSAASILEYGGGATTILAAQLGASVVSVINDREWADRVAARVGEISDRAKVHYVSIGPTKNGGMPRNIKFAPIFYQYALSVWDRADLGDPDLVFIGGRFRPACLLSVFLRAKRPTTVLFHDYSGRKHYQGVERLVDKEEVVGRMARFTVTPGRIPPDLVTEAIGWFSNPL